MDNQNESMYLEHHGILGQKWGVRRYQNYDGTLTKAGQKHIDKLESQSEARSAKAKKISNSSSELSKRQQNKINKLNQKNKDSKSELNLIKKQLMQKGDINSIMQNKELFTTKELNKIIERKNAEETLTGKDRTELIKGNQKAMIPTTQSIPKVSLSRDEIDSIVNSGDAKLVYENRDKLSTNELNTAYNRISAIKNVKNSIETPKTKTDEFIEKGNKVRNVTQIVSNTMANISSFARSGKGFMETIGLIDKSQDGKAKESSGQTKTLTDIQTIVNRSQNGKAKESSGPAKALAKATSTYNNAQKSYATAVTTETLSALNKKKDATNNKLYTKMFPNGTATTAAEKSQAVHDALFSMPMSEVVARDYASK